MSTTLLMGHEDPILFGLTLVEGKSIGTAHASDLKLSKNLQAAKDTHHKEHAAPVKAGQSVGRRKLAEVAAGVERSLNRLINRYQRNKIDGPELRQESQAAMRKAWKEVFQAGLRAAGVPGGGSGPGKPLVYLGENDTAWLKSAMAHEMRYLNGMLRAIEENDFTMPIERRVAMYAASLSSFYESARIIGLPANVITHWVGPDDVRKCEGCRYLLEHSPYSKFNLPTVPRAGLTACLTACRDKLFIRKATPAEVKAVVEAHQYTRETHIRNLRRLKATGSL